MYPILEEALKNAKEKGQDLKVTVFEFINPKSEELENVEIVMSSEDKERDAEAIQKLFENPRVTITTITKSTQITVDPLDKNSDDGVLRPSESSAQSYRDAYKICVHCQRPYQKTRHACTNCGVPNDDM